MKLRNLIRGFSLVSVAVGLAATLVAVGARREELRTSAVRTQAQEASHEVSSLLALTQEYARHLEPHAAEQWHQRHAMIAGLIGIDEPGADQDPALTELRGVSQSLPELFMALEKVPQDDSTFSLRRKEVLLDQLLTSTQAMSDYAYQWFQNATVAERNADRRFQYATFSVLGTLLLMLVALMVLIQRSVLNPLGRLDQATAAASQGDMSLRVASRANNELGDLSRRFDAMLQTLAQRRQQLQDSAKRLRLITDNMPSLIAYIDRDLRYQFINAYFQHLLEANPLALQGQRVADALGASNYATLQPHLEAALGGERQHFERMNIVHGKEIWLLTDYIPDINEAGEVVGIFATAKDITELKEIQSAHAKGEERLRMVTDNLPALIAHIDAEERYTFVNAHIGRTFGGNAQMMVGRTMREMRPTLYQSLAPHVKAVLRGEPQTFEGVGMTVDGEHHYQSNYIPDVGPQGEVRGFYAMTFDITDRKRVELLQAQSEQRLRAITNNIPAMVGHFDAQERCLFANDTVLKLRGIDAKDVHLHTLRSGLGDDNYAQHQPYVERVLKGEICGFEGHLHREGLDLYFQAHLVPDWNAQNQVQGFYLMSFDVTKVRRAEQARKRSEQRLRQITDNLPVLISYLDQQTAVRFANETYRDWLGVDPQVLLGRSMREIVGPELYEPRREHVERALRGERVAFESEITALGITRALTTSYVPDVDSDGTVLGIYTLSSDISALKAYERQLQALARFDTLTGLPNRLQFNEKMPEALERAERSGQGVALMFLDVDRFKSINDSLGHAAGDVVLREFAQRLQASVRHLDLVARLAGDEFVVILEGLHSDAEAQAVAQKIVDAMARPMNVEGNLLRVSSSIGVAYQDKAAPAITTPDLLARADKALYDAKSAGRNTFRMA